VLELAQSAKVVVCPSSFYLMPGRIGWKVRGYSFTGDFNTGKGYPRKGEYLFFPVFPQHWRR